MLNKLKVTPNKTLKGKCYIEDSDDEDEANVTMNVSKDDSDNEVSD